MEERKRRTLVVGLILALAAVAVAVRLVNLGALGFFGDEETTALAARSLAEGSGSQMPSGMPYRRALPFTWLNAVSARYLGLDSEFAYRLPAALIGGLTVPLLYFVTAGIAGPGAGLLAALLLAVSGWHLVWSRTARMYAPLLFVALAFFAASYRWQRTGRPETLAVAFLLYLLAVVLHSAGGAIALFPVLFALLYDSDRIRARDGVVVGLLMGICGWSLDRLFVVAPYEKWATDFSIYSSAPAGQLADSVGAIVSGLPTFSLFLVPLGLLTGIGLARATAPTSTGNPRLSRLATVGLSSLAVAAGFAGLPGAAASLAVAALLVDGRGWRAWWSPHWIAAAAFGTLVGAVARYFGIQVGLRGMIMTPFPYLPYLGTLFPALLIAFGIAVLWLALRGTNSKLDDRPLRISALFVVAYMLALGFARDWAPWRYLLLAYPWILIVVGAGIQGAVTNLAERVPRLGKNGATALAVVLILVGLFGGHGIPATLTVVGAEYGSSIPWNDVGMEVRPDHRGPGLIVRRQAKASDIVIAEDALEQRWYAGRVDHWFRSADDARKFLYRDTAGIARDIYVSSALMDRPPDMDLLSRDGGAVWLITSGETALARDWYLSEEQATWLSEIEATIDPVYEGRDGLSAVYCFGLCPAVPGGGSPY